MSKTKDMIRRLLEFDPAITNTKIGETLGLSRQLVSHHTRTMNMPRQSPNRSCNHCGKRITRYNASGLCKECRPLQYAYEYQCAYCGEVHVALGRDATNRRNSKKYKVNPDLDFCTMRCAQRYKGMI
jgi:hypothetical protein